MAKSGSAKSDATAAQKGSPGELFRGCAELIGGEDLQQKLDSGQRLTIKVGFDPTAPDLHLGHTVVLTAMRRLQDAGHRVIFLIGDFTARIGDPSGRDITRPPLSDEEIAANTRTYTEQVSGVLDMEKAEIRYNSEWLGQMDGADLIRLASRITLARMLERDGFGARHGQNSPISLHELLYPLAQGWDSVVLEADVEMGGTDQRFNMLLGRQLQQQMGQKPQAVVCWPLLVGTDGVRKMSKSLDNCVVLQSEASEMFGRLMSISDELMWNYYELLSLKARDEIGALKDGHPRDAKLTLAEELVGRYRGQDEAPKQRQAFIDRFSKGIAPDESELPVHALAAAKAPPMLANALCEVGLASSASEVRRLIRQQAVQLDGRTLRAEDSPTPPPGTYVLRLGKKRMMRLQIVEDQGEHP